MKKFLPPLILGSIVILLCSCSRQGSVSAPGASGINAPEIISATLYPEKPTANTQLIVHYTSKNGGEGHINCTIRWFVDNEIVQDGPLGTLEPGVFKKNSTVFAEVTPSSPSGAGKTFRTAPITIENLPPVVEGAQITPTDPPVGAILTVTPNGTDPDGDSIKYSYVWKVNGKAVTDAMENNTFKTTGLHKKDMVFAVVTASDWEVQSKEIDSDIVVLADSAPRITSTPPSALQGETYIYQVTAADPDKDRITYSLETAPPGMTIDASTGLIRWEAPKQVAEKQEIPVKIKADDGDGGSAYQEYSLFLEMK